MDLMKRLQDKAARKSSSVVLPEAINPKIVDAAAKALNLGIAKPILIGKQDVLSSFGIDLTGMVIVDHENSPKVKEYARVYSTNTGFPEDYVQGMMLDPLNFAAMMVSTGDSDSMVAGLTFATEQIIMASQMFIGMAEGVNTPSSYFVMENPGWAVGENGLLVFADCAVVPNPSSQELAEIAISTADSVVSLLGWAPRVAMLSFSTKGSASHPDVEKVIKALELVKQQRADIHIDGELQADSALVPGVAEKKLKNVGAVAGKANVLIFPTLDAGNIGYKLVQRLSGAAAYGPVLQGFAKPVSDLSRGATVEDIVGAITIVAAQCKE